MSLVADEAGGIRGYASDFVLLHSGLRNSNQFPLKQTYQLFDPVTYALSDPDEAIRARAQELFEQELERR